ncbi:MAG: DUF507 family protein [Nitrospirae bacterium]|nr:DUF507 family protein [Nitrospirota bacterium]MBF0542570.1 DUF507 family protein [Nitrospirota bacterium]
MRIPDAWVPILADKIIESIISKDWVKLNVSQKELTIRAIEIMIEELTVEDRLNAEVNERLKSFNSVIENRQMDYNSLFEMTKRKLIKERNIII